mmetsp:Transcript_6396/g.17199  ORF Transcript_6396/g.17199 Transcript_6396/m.17199 type:complete len:404 (-) Transcript_6396:68-1279(-)
MLGACLYTSFLAALLLVQPCASLLNGHPGAQGPREFTIDLDLPPMDRWKEITLAYKHMLPGLLLKIEANTLGATKADGIDRRQWLTFHNIESEYISELVGVVKWANDSEVTLERLVWFNLQYEMTKAHLCTGVLAVDKNGEVYHGRNFDWNLFWNGPDRKLSLEDIAIDVTYTRRGVPVFSSVTFVGMNGVHTGLAYARGASWSFEQNTRVTDDGQRNLVAAKAGGKPYSYVMRSLMERSINFKTAVKEVERSKISADMYFIMAGSGPWEGAVVTLDSASHEKSLNNVQVLSPSIGRWFLVQTNDDMWTEALDSRRPEGVAFISHMGQENVNMDNLLVMLRTYPLFNEGTLWTTMTLPSMNYHRTWMFSETVEIIVMNRQRMAMTKVPSSAQPVQGRETWLKR